MSLAVVLFRGLAGLDSPLVRVEVHTGGGLPNFHIVGLPEAEVREARDRVRAALATARLDLVTREEFDVQSEVLARARIRVAELEARLATNK